MARSFSWKCNQRSAADKSIGTRYAHLEKLSGKPGVRVEHRVQDSRKIFVKGGKDCLREKLEYRRKSHTGKAKQQLLEGTGGQLINNFREADEMPLRTNMISRRNESLLVASQKIIGRGRN